MDALCTIGRSLGGRPILIPTTDQGSMWVAENSAVLREVFCFPDQDAALVRTLCDKNLMKDLARRSGVPTAQSIVPRSRKTWCNSPRTAVFPVMVKATDSERLRRCVGGTKFLSRQAANSLSCTQGRGYEAQLTHSGIHTWGRLDVRRLLDENSRCIFGVTGRRSAGSRLTPASPAWEFACAMRPFRRPRLTSEDHRLSGILDIGYRYDTRDGLYKVWT